MLMFYSLSVRVLILSWGLSTAGCVVIQGFKPRQHFLELGMRTQLRGRNILNNCSGPTEK